MTEGKAIILATAAHLALLAALSLSWSMTQKDLPSFAEAVPVDIVEVSDLARITEPPKPSIAAAPQQMIEAAAPEPAPERAPPAPQPAPAPAESAISSVPPPKPQKKPDPQPAEATPQTKPAPQPAEAKAKPQETPVSPAAKKAPQRLDPQELANLLDKKLPKAARKPLNTSDLASAIEKALPKGAKLDARATATLEQAIRSQIAPCWNPPIGGADVRKMTVQLRIQLARNGQVVGQPEVIGQTGVSGDNTAYAKAFAESARRAVLRCQPLTLPLELYEAWKLFELNFDPSQMT